MANQLDRDTMGEMMMREFRIYATALAQRHTNWADVWPSVTHSPNDHMAVLRGRFEVAREAATVVGIERSDDDITTEHRARLAYRETYPDGAPNLDG
ncbi:hypothetical protein ACWF9B_08550 [Streptomyces sp. NPDC055089]